VLYHREVVLSPIEVATDEMRVKVTELQEVTSLNLPDVKRLQLKLAGAVNVTVRYKCLKQDSVKLKVLIAWVTQIMKLALVSE